MAQRRLLPRVPIQMQSLGLMTQAQQAARTASQAAGATPAQAEASGAAAAEMVHLAAQPTTPDNAARMSALSMAHPIAAATAMQMLTVGLGAKWEERDDAVNPIGGPTRRKPFPIKLLPATSTPVAGAGVLQWAPQEEFEAFRICVPTGQPPLPCFFNNLLVGDVLMMAQTGRMPSVCWGEKTDLGRIDFPVCRLGELISVAYSGTAANTELAAVLLGYGRGRLRALPDGSELLHERVEPFDVTVVPASGVATITLTPQRHIIMRRLGFDDTVTNFANLYVTSITVQDSPQFVGPSSEIPGQLFSELAQDDWIDFDICQLGGTVTIGLRNSNTSQNVTAQGLALVDLVRLPQDPR